MKITNGVFKQCKRCYSVSYEKLPPGYSYTIAKGGRLNPRAVYYTVHSPDCPKRFKAVEVGE